MHICIGRLCAYKPCHDDGAPNIHTHTLRGLLRGETDTAASTQQPAAASLVSSCHSAAVVVGEYGKRRQRHMKCMFTFVNICIMHANGNRMPYGCTLVYL